MTPQETARQQAAVMLAFAEGKEIEFRYKGKPDVWKRIYNNPFWDFPKNDYRVKPEERKPREWQMWINESGARLFQFAENANPREDWTKITVREVLPETETES